MKHFQRIGLMIVGVMAIAAFVGTSAASATTPGKFTATGGKVKLTSSVVTQPVISMTGNQFKCNKNEFAGETTGAEASEQVVTPSFGECTFFGFAVTVETGTCVLKLTATTDKANGHAEAHLEKCGASGGITIKIENAFTKCIVHIKEQTFKGVHYVNNASPEDIKAQFTVSGIHFETTTSTGLCPLTVGTHTNGTLTGEITFQATGGLQYDEL